MSLSPEIAIENPKYLREQIITYLGNKRSLLDFIEKSILHAKSRMGQKKLSTLDLFSGSGIVSRFFKQHSSHIIANDLEKYSSIINQCFLSNQSKIDWQELTQHHHQLQQRIQAIWQEGFISELYAPKDETNIQPHDRVFYTKRNAQYLDTARQAISELPAELQKYFLAPLLASASIHANTSGVFKGFYKNAKGVGTYGGSGKNALRRILGNIEVELPILSHFECPSLVCQEDAYTLVRHIKEVDFAYIDPPYNQHPYGSNYFMLNILTDYTKPHQISKISGIPTDWNRSPYNKRAEAQAALFQLVEQCPAKFLLISYNSEGFIAYESFIEELQKLGDIRTLETPYNTFRASRNLRKRPLTVTEFLFLIEKH